VPLASPPPSVAAVPLASPSAAPVPCPNTRTVPPETAPTSSLGGTGFDTTGLLVPPGVPAPPTISAASWVVADLDSGQVLAACGPHVVHPPASVQKLLLAETVLPELNPDTVVDATQEDLDLPKDSSAVGLILGGHYTVSTLWLGLLLESGNDCANALARVGGGTGGVPATIEAMNAEAHRLGADDTHAVTPSGLDGPGQLTSAYDLALIARADFARPAFVTYDSTLRYQWPAQPPKDPRGFQIQNENKLLTQYPGAIGGKTGFTDAARHTYVGAAARNGRRLEVTIMNAEAVPIRAWQQGIALLDWGFAVPSSASVGHLVTPEEAAKLHRQTPVPTPAGTVRALPPQPQSSGTLGLVLLVSAVPVLGILVVCPPLIWRAVRRTR